VDVAYVNSGVLTPEEVTASRFGGSTYSTDTTIDLDGRETNATAFKEMYKPEPPEPVDEQPATEMQP
jgi:hypothetical protein